MPVEPSTTLFYAKALVLALLASSATTDSIREGIVHSSPALNAPVTNTRSLRSSLFMKTSDEMDKSEGRMLVLSPSLEEIFLANNLKSEAEVMGFRQEYSNKRFTDLKLDKLKVEQLFASVDRFKQWLHEVLIAHLKDAHGNYKDSKDLEKNALRAISKTLIAHYNEDDLAKVVLVALRNPSKYSQVIASFMIRTQLQKWADDGTSAGYVFSLLQLGQSKGELMGSPNFLQWVDFVMSANPESEEAALSAMFDTLSSHYNDDAALFTALLAGFKIEKTKSVAFFLGIHQVQKWIADKKTPQDIFKSLRLDEAKGQLFESPLIEIWGMFVESSHHDTVATIYETMYATIKAHYSDYDLTKIIAEGPYIAYGYRIAVELKKVEVLKWVKAKMTEEDVFELLELNKVKDDLFESPLMNTWGTFVAISYPDHATMCDKFYTTLKAHYRDYDLAKILIEGQHNDIWHSIAVELETLEFSKWNQDQKSREDVHQLLMQSTTDNSDSKILLDSILDNYMEFCHKIEKNGMPSKW